MTLYFFDFRSGDMLSVDEEGCDLPDLDAAHEQALGALVNGICEVSAQGQTNQSVAVEVRDEIGPVLEITAVVGSRILRKQ